MTSFIHRFSLTGGCKLAILLCLTLLVGGVCGATWYPSSRELLCQIAGLSGAIAVLLLMALYPEQTFRVCAFCYNKGCYIAAAGGVMCVPGIVIMAMLKTVVVLAIAGGILMVGMAMMAFGVGMGGYLEDQGYGGSYKC